MTNEQILRALALLRSVSSDIESMRDGDDDYFGPFSEWTEEESGTGIEWPNLSITGRDITAFLKTVKG